MMFKTAIFPGSFDPITLGHQDLLQRAAPLFDKIIVAVADNADKRPALSLENRLACLQIVLKDFPTIEIETFRGLTVAFARQRQASVILRGLRSAADFDYEMQLAQMNRRLDEQVQTLWLPASPAHVWVSASTVRQIARLGGDVSGFVDARVIPYLGSLQSTLS